MVIWEAAPGQGQGAKIYSMFALTDEAYALTLQAERNNYSSTRILAIQGLLHASWTTSVLAGALLGSLIPESIKGLEFAVTALFAVLAIEAFTAYRSVPLSLLAATVALHLLKSNAVPSVLGGTAVHVGILSWPL